MRVLGIKLWLPCLPSKCVSHPAVAPSPIRNHIRVSSGYHIWVCQVFPQSRCDGHGPQTRLMPLVTEEPIASVRCKGNSRALGKHQDVTDGQDEGGSELFLLPTGLVFPYTSYLLSEAKTTMKPISHGRKVRCKGEGKQPHSLHSSPGFTTSETRFSVTGQTA